MFALAPLAAADGPTDLPFVKLTGLVLGAMILWWAIRRLFGGGKPLRPRSGWMSGPVLASATTRLRLRSGWMSGPVLASATTRLRLRSGWMSGPVLASATTRLRLRSGEDV